MEKRLALSILLFSGLFPSPDHQVLDLFEPDSTPTKMAAPGGFYIAQPSPNGLINPAATTPWTQPPTRPTLLDELKTRTAFTTWSILKKTLAAVQLFYFLLLFIYFLLPFASEAYIKSVLYSDEEEYRKRENEFGKVGVFWGRK